MKLNAQKRFGRSPGASLRAGGMPGFSLVELLAVIVIVAIVAAISIPVVTGIRASAADAQCLSNLRQLGSSALLFSNDNGGMTVRLDSHFNEQLWPYLYPPEQADEVVFWGADFPDVLQDTVFACPRMSEDQARYARSYGVNECLLGMRVSLSDKAAYGVPMNQVEYPSRAVLFGDVLNSSALRPATVNGRHEGNMNAVFVDGHTEVLPLTSRIVDAGSLYSNTEVFWIGIDP